MSLGITVCNGGVLVTAVRYDNDYYTDPEVGQIRKYSKQKFASKYTWILA